MSDQSVQNALQHNLPPMPKFDKLVRLHPVRLDRHFAKPLEEGHEDGHEGTKNKEEDQASQEDIGLFDTRSKADTIDPPDNDNLRVSTGAGTACASHHGLGTFPTDGFDDLECSLLDLNRGSGESG